MRSVAIAVASALAFQPPAAAWAQSVRPPARLAPPAPAAGRAARGPALAPWAGVALSLEPPSSPLLELPRAGGAPLALEAGPPQGPRPASAVPLGPEVPPLDDADPAFRDPRPANPPIAGDAGGLGQSRERIERRLQDAGALERLAAFTGIPALARGLLMQRLASDLLGPSTPAPERAKAARRLAALGRPEAIETLGWASAFDPAPQVRSAAAQALVSAARAHASALAARLASGRAATRIQAARALAWLARQTRDPALFDALARAVQDPSKEDASLAAVEALRQAGGSAEPRLAKLLDGESRERVRAALTWARLHEPSGADLGEAKDPLQAAALRKVIGIGLVFAAIELAGSVWSGSLALRADALHLALDTGVSAATLFALWISRRPPTARRTYGYAKMEPLVGFVSSAAIFATAFELGQEAAARLLSPVAVPGLATIGLAFSGLAANIFAALILRRYRGDGVGMRGAFLHALSDALGSVGIIASGLAVYFFQWHWADPFIGVGICLLIAHTAWGLLKSSWHLLMDGVPEGVDLAEVEARLKAIPGVRLVHDLHIWSLSSLERGMTAHLYLKEGADPEAVLAAATALARDAYKIRHATFQAQRHAPA
ncbi:MAG: cation diffusion facilitator family transporter [Elusimicrobia bacterium]|nr:cation diffusion facilitator family transporter [Elusimicrobiota bacterium]